MSQFVHSSAAVYGISHLSIFTSPLNFIKLLKMINLTDMK